MLQEDFMYKNMQFSLEAQIKAEECEKCFLVKSEEAP